MSILNQLQQDANSAVDSGVAVDMNQVQKGGGERKVYPEGTTLARLVGVIELGKLPVSFQGQAKAPQRHVMLQFAMFSPGFTWDEEGKIPGVINSPEMTLTFTEKSKVKKLFMRMNYKGTAKHFSQMLGEAFLISLKHNKKEDKVYVNLDLDSILPPVEPISKQPYAVPEAPESMYRLFLWDKPTQAQWDSLLIKDNEGKPLEKQWLQTKLTEALDFNESPLFTLLHGAMPALAAAPAPMPAAPSLPQVPVGTPAAHVPAAPAASGAPDVPWAAPAVPTAPAAPVPPVA